MPKCTDTIKQHEVQTFQDAVELRGVVCGKFSCRSCLCQMLIELITQILSPLVTLQDFDGTAVMLHDSPHLECLICLKHVIFALQEKGGHVPGRIVREGDKVPLTLAR